MHHLASGQTLAAQGVIHGGLKYAVGGKLTDSSEALAGMPSRWLAAMRGEGPVDLRGAKLLSDHQLMWSLPNVVSQVVSFFGSKALRGRSAAIAREDYPAVFDTPDYKGRLFRIDEPVVDPVSILRELARGVAEETYLVEWGKNARLGTSGGQIDSITITGADGHPSRSAQAPTSSPPERAMANCSRHSGSTNRRCSAVRFIRSSFARRGLPEFYSVCVGTGPKPPLVSTTHVDSAGRTVWYLGGDLAEQEGVARSEAEQIAFTQALLAKLMPWINLTGAEWFTWRGDRAEPLTGTGDRPPGAYCRRVGNVLVAWPTKLALAPDLAEQVLRETTKQSGTSADPLPLPHPPLGKPPWDLP
jgi:hypothetical protein